MVLLACLGHIAAVALYCDGECGRVVSDLRERGPHPRRPLEPSILSALFLGGSGRDRAVGARRDLLSRACGVHVKNIGCRRRVMHAVIRSYSGKGTKALFDLLEKNKAEVESLIRGVKGFVSYSLVRTTRGGFSVSVYQDKAGADESTRAARAWIAKNASKTGVARPTISEGTVMLQLK